MLPPARRDGGNFYTVGSTISAYRLLLAGKESIERSIYMMLLNHTDLGAVRVEIFSDSFPNR